MITNDDRDAVIMAGRLQQMGKVLQAAMDGRGTMDLVRDLGGDAGVLAMKVQDPDVREALLKAAKDLIEFVDALERTS